MSDEAVQFFNGPRDGEWHPHRGARAIEFPASPEDVKSTLGAKAESREYDYVYRFIDDGERITGLYVGIR